MKMSNSSIAIKNMIWRFLERSGAQLVSFVVSIILARILMPEVYGKVALINVFIAIANVFVDSGFGSALVQKEKVESIDYSTVFIFNIFSCTIIYIILFFVSPYIALLYKMPELTNLIRVVGITIIISGVKSIQQSYVSKNLLFRKFFFATIGGTIIAAIVGIFMACNGYGIWALVAQSVTNNFIDTVVLWIIVDWRPSLEFSYKRLRGLFGFGWKMFISALLDTVYLRLKSLLIGKVYTSVDLALYDRGESIPLLVVGNINSAIDSVLFPVMSEHQSNKEIVKNMTRKSMQIATFIMAPLMIGLAACSKSMILIVLTDKWLGAVYYIQVFCLIYMFYPLHTANLNAIKALGRSDLFLKLEMLKKIIGFLTILITVFISVKAMAIGALVASILNQLINSWPNKKLLGYSYIEQVRDIIPNILLAVLMGIIIYPISLLRINNYVILLIQIFVGMILYIIGARFFCKESFEYVLMIIKHERGNKNGR